MIQATDVNVIEAGDGTKALAIDLVLIVPLNESGVVSTVNGLLGIEPPTDDPTTDTEQDNTTEENA